jgi:hypothetical protein
VRAVIADRRRLLAPCAQQRRVIASIADHAEVDLAPIEIDAADRRKAIGDRLSQQLTESRLGQALSRSQLAELARLRGEVGLLRRDSQELAQLRARPQAVVAQTGYMQGAAGIFRSPWQGMWQPLSGRIKKEGNRLVYQIDADQVPEFVYQRGEKGTDKVRWIWPATGDSCDVRRPTAQSRNVSAMGTFRLELDRPRSGKHPRAARLCGFRGRSLRQGRARDELG